MADRDWRNLERAFLGGDTTVLPALNAARVRSGLPIFRLEIIHYLKTDYHHRLRGDGSIDPRVDQGRILSACGACELWPRAYYERKRTVRYTPDKRQVTCKSCLKVMGGLRFKEGPLRLHLLLKHEDGKVWTMCGGKFGQSTEVIDQVQCEGCLRKLTGKSRTVGGHELNARGRRRLRRQTMFAFKYPPTGSQSDPFRHGVC